MSNTYWHINKSDIQLVLLCALHFAWHRMIVCLHALCFKKLCAEIDFKMLPPMRGGTRWCRFSRSFSTLWMCAGFLHFTNGSPWITNVFILLKLNDYDWNKCFCSFSLFVLLCLWNVFFLILRGKFNITRMSPEFKFVPDSNSKKSKLLAPVLPSNWYS